MMLPNLRYILAPYVPTPEEVVHRMLELTELTRNDVVYDLGCGDGRIVIEAAKRYGARGVGVDVEAYWIEQACSNADAAGVQELVRFEHADAMSVHLANATVVTLYLVHWSTKLITSKLVERVQPGTRIVSHNFDVDGWAPERTASLEDREGKGHNIYVWVAGRESSTTSHS